jgi:hypothetical protein
MALDLVCKITNLLCRILPLVLGTEIPPLLKELEQWKIFLEDSERSGDQQERQMRYRTLLGLEDTRVEAILVSGIHLPVGKNLLEISA